VGVGGVVLLLLVWLPYADTHLGCNDSSVGVDEARPSQVKFPSRQNVEKRHPPWQDRRRVLSAGQDACVPNVARWAVVLPWVIPVPNEYEGETRRVEREGGRERETYASALAVDQDTAQPIHAEA
jgi:hypothetical protein